MPTDGVYKLQVWGAQGGYSGNPKGSGGYAEGNIALHKDELLYVCVGGQPTDCNVGGYNGGGPSYQSSTNDSCGGGGGTDIRIGTNSLYARVIVAG
ncbi:MAG: hypothetical protein LBP53_06805 [Candidatus Peribacteria bacterium]|nr:hypothetical protein [Candidatus Peribacteria bacterium]